MHRPEIIQLTFAFVVLALIVSCQLSLRKKSQLDRTKRANGEQIVRALEAYLKDHEAYPEKLEKLEPKYLPKVPWVTRSREDLNRPYNYEVSQDGKEFTLSYDEAPIGMFPSDAIFEYRSSSAAWEHKIL